MSKFVNKRLENDAIFKDPRYVPNIGRNNTKKKGQPRPKIADAYRREPVHQMEKHIQAMAEHTFMPMQTSTKATLPSKNKEGRQVRTSYTFALKADALVKLRLFLKQYNKLDQLPAYKACAFPGVVFVIHREKPIIRKGKEIKTDSLTLTDSMFKRVIKKPI